MQVYVFEENEFNNRSDDRRMHAIVFSMLTEDCEVNDTDMDDDEMNNPNNYGKTTQKINDIIYT